jgi:eukaryotic-like serine/threonine-protein kinase
MPQAPPGAPAPPALPDFVRALRDSRLLCPAQLLQLEDLRRACRQPRDLARALVRLGWLTAWQLNRVYRGRGATLTVGSYRLLGRLGRGGMAEVFLAAHARLGRLVALKLLAPDRLGRGGGAGRFLREVRAAARLDHPNAVHAYDAGRAGDSYYLAMEYVEGTDLKRLVQREGPLGPDRARDYVRQAALGLQHALGRGVVHRDLKPSNLLLSWRGVVKVLDLGLAHLWAQGAEGGGERLTAAGQGLGTADYVAPEQILDGRSADTRADLYALGGTLYYLLRGHPPFPGGTRQSKLLRHLREEPAPLGAGVPAGLAAVARKLLQKEPARRFQTPAELADALGGA